MPYRNRPQDAIGTTSTGTFADLRCAREPNQWNPRPRAGTPDLAQVRRFGTPIGHHKLSWQGSTEKNVKHKTFWVTCDGSEGGGLVEG